MAADPALPAEALDLQPIGKLAPGTLPTLAALLSRRLHLACHVLPETELPLPRLAGRSQLDASALLASLETRASAPARLVVGVTAEDIALAIFTFVFGLARQGGRACLVSLARTDPTFYGLAGDENLRNQRAVAEILHELGHLARLDHCPDQGCLMSFAGNVQKVDARGVRFCAACTPRLPGWLRGPAAVRDPGDLR
jgi:predicted Zn-dependent protease